MAHQTGTPEIETAQIERAEQGWTAFTKYGTWFIFHVIAIVVLMAIFLL